MERSRSNAGASAATAVALSAAIEGFGQAYNRQPVKAGAFLVSGLTLSTVSGLNTWIVRNVLGMRSTRIGPERVNAALLALWAVTYGLSLVDAWRTARKANQSSGS